MHPLGKFNDREGVVKIKLIHIVLFGLAVNIFDILDFGSWLTLTQPGKSRRPVSLS